ncbi:MAG: Lrp/AsnC family transcriptional regulator [Thermodesulfobacteriota bacterium]|nr:MAG: Lrp/AsnC family transcriptional regulator [Thermodesulfobacteriota bacterium]RLG12090.1 MAG: Lrp/AsnC family transcriptional regulator [Candidatus Pacearchaeota archaeon]
MKNKIYKDLLNILQEDFPLHPRPFKIIGEKLGLSEEEILKYLQDLKNKGVLRHLGASPDSYKLKHITCLCAVSIPQDKLYIAEEIARLPEVTHGYIRKHNLNFWFTIVTKSEKDLNNIIKKLEDKYKIKIRKFPAVKKFKIKAVFKV